MFKTRLAIYGLAALLGTAGQLTAAQTGFGKRVVINKTDQTLRAYEGGQLVFKSRVSTGRPGKETPCGSFSAKSKSRMHYSSLYENAPMPYSVQISGNYFIHGFSSVPNWPASHGCIRLPLNAAPAFYNWVEPGTPISVTGKWAGMKQRQPARRYRGMPALAFGGTWSR
jgi:lipoprotein-anchoring transpeptidase ErfK/SrfK